MKTIEACLEENMSQKLDVELKVPEQNTNEECFTLSGVKLWILTEPSASWQSFAMSLYSAELDTALQKAKAKNLLTPKGVDCYANNYDCISLHCLIQYFLSYECVLFYLQMRHLHFQIS